MSKKLIVFILLIFTFSAFASKVDTLTVNSESMNKSIKNVVIIPDGYISQSNPYPVIYICFMGLVAVIRLGHFISPI
ncbi:MAG: hypothetical protein ACJAYY_002279 [Paraglaciecola sp.]|jgi:hypothetical protein